MRRCTAIGERRKDEVGSAPNRGSGRHRTLRGVVGRRRPVSRATAGDHFEVPGNPRQLRQDDGHPRHRPHGNPSDPNGSDPPGIVRIEQDHRLQATGRRSPCCRQLATDHPSATPPSRNRPSWLAHATALDAVDHCRDEQRAWPRPTAESGMQGPGAVDPSGRDAAVQGDRPRLHHHRVEHRARRAGPGHRRSPAGGNDHGGYHQQ